MESLTLPGFPAVMALSEPQALRALLVEDSEEDAVLLIEALRRGGYAPTWERVDSEPALRAALARDVWDVVFCDYSTPGIDALSALRVLRETGDTVTAIVVSGPVGEDVAVEAMRLGANDFILRKNLGNLAPTMERQLRAGALRRERQALRQSEERLRELLENVAMVAVTLDQEGRVTFCNDYLLEMTGWEREEVMGADWFELFVPHDGAAKSLFVDFLKMGEISAHHESAIATKSGVARTIAWNNTILRDPGGKIVGSASIGEDITEHRRADERVLEQAALLDHAQDAILVKDQAGRILYWNKSAERVFGWTAEEAVGELVQDLLYDDSETYRLALETTLARGAWIGDVTKRVKGGGHVIIEGRWTLVRDDAGRPKSILAINTDITERRQMETHLFRAQRMESIGSLAGGIAHDLNNVLGPIIMGVDLLRLRITEPKDCQLLDLLEMSGRRGIAMVKQVLYFARGLEGKRTLVCPVQLVQELARTIEYTFPRSILLDIEPGAGPWKIPGDRTQLYQVLLNLCVNARDAMPNGGRLRISTANLMVDEQFAGMQQAALPGPYVVITVADTGTGMTPELAGNVFDAFFTTKGTGEGTGLGLFTTQAIVKSHEGFIVLQTEPGKGTSFQVYLPAEIEVKAKEAEITPEKIPHGNGELILIIDDEASIRSITAETLEAFGYRVISACDGVAGVAQYGRQIREIAAVITDMAMPIMDGRATIMVLLRMNPDVKIIATSGSTAPGSDEGVSAGAQYFLPKPYTAETILRTLHQLLQTNGEVS
jgi:PAS domain S-box-containing protein